MMSSKGVFAFFICLCCALVAIPLAASSEQTFTVRFSQQALRTEERYLLDDTYVLMRLEETDLTLQPGLPCLPVRTMNVYVPRGLEIKQITVESVKATELPGEYLLLPGQQQIPLSSDVLPDPTPPDEVVYAQSDLYPVAPVRLASSGSIAGRKIASLHVFPLQYTPAARRLTFNEEVSFKIEFGNAGSEPSIPRETPGVRRLRNDIVGRLTDSPADLQQDFPTGFGTLDPSVATEYLIICIENHTDEYEILKDWKTRKGVPATIVTAQSIFDTYPGRDEQEKLRNCIMDYYLNQSTVWVLMTLAAPKAKIRGCYCSVGGTVDPGIPCDLYFADMDGDWNEDNDSRWGETGDDVDLYPDVYLGRLPENTGVQAMVAIEKVLTYEGYYEIPADYQLEMLFLAEYADAQTDGAIAKNMIDNESVPSRFDPITKLYQSSGNLNHSSAMNALNSGMGLINHDGHGNSNVLSIGPSALDSDDMRSLTNGPRYSVFYTVACTPGNFENPLGCFARAFVESPDGGGFFVGNSRYGWYWPGNPGYGTGELFDREFFESIFVRDHDHLGIIHADAKVQRIPWSGSNNTDRWTQFTSNLFGDPETPVWKDTPIELSVSHPGSLLVGNHLITITVDAQSSPLDQARVCLWKEDEVYQVDHTDGSGEVQFQFSVMEGGSILVTATKNGYIPYMGSVGVGGDLSGIGDVDRLERNPLIRVSPNPVTGSAVIAYALPQSPNAGLDRDGVVRIYDASGRFIASLPLGVDASGKGSLTWDGKNSKRTVVPSGIYFAELSYRGLLTSTKFVILR